MIKTQCFEVMGVSHYVDKFFEALSYENGDYDLSKKEIKEEFEDGDKIYRYEFSAKEAKLIPEPDNEYDPNAIRVEADGFTIGHIKKTETAKVKELLSAEDLYKIEIKISGGDYKLVSEDEDEKITVEKDSCNYFADVFIKTGTPEPVASYTGSESNQAKINPAAVNVLSIITIVLSVLIILSSLLLLVVALPLGLAFLIFGIIILLFGIKQRKKSLHGN